jgi:hypothetical protein
MSQPQNSRVQLEYTLVSRSVQRRAPSHYVQEGTATIYVDGIPAKAGGQLLLSFAQAPKPKAVGKFHFCIAQTFQAMTDGIDFSEIFSKELAPILGLFNNDKALMGYYREDIPIDPSNTLVIVDKFEITNPVFDHESLKQQCLEEFVRVFCYIEVIALHQSVKVDAETLKAMKFAKVSETQFFLRDNCIHFGGQMPDPPVKPPTGILGLLLGGPPMPEES